MCLAIPATVLELYENNMAEVEMLGVTRKVSLDMIEGANVGDWVLVHAGFVIEKVDEEYAKETLDLLEQIPWMHEEAPQASDRFLEIAEQARAKDSL
ncbi:MAG: HypC/HybG/HupF family hydrogenase formation chaperone [Coriobacteriia bacterium]|nr:HypC/HybG/HupF family hydrogenase formation chaperone [Coriobacteriia bacterium]